MMERISKIISNVTIVLFIIMLALVIFQPRGGSVVVERHTDTLTVREVIRDTVLVPVTKHITRTDTVRLTVPGDTVRIPVLVPIERVEYRTSDYHAVIEGFSPRLVQMEVFPLTKYITNTEVRTVPARWGFGIHAGIGYGSDGLTPIISVGFQYMLFTF